MRVTFCDLCNESVPQSDLEQGAAVLRKGRVVCATCEAVMTSGAAAPGEPDGFHSPPTSAGPAAAQPAHLEPLPRVGEDTTLMDAQLDAPLVPQVQASSVGATIAVALASVSLILTVGAAAWLYDLFERRGRDFVAELQDQDLSWREATNSMEVRLTHTIRDASSGASSTRDELEELGARFDALGIDQDSNWSDLRDDFAQLQGKIGELDNLIVAASRNDAKIDKLAETTASLHDTVLRFGGRLAALEGGRGATARESAPAEPLEDEPGEPAWVALLGDLADQDPGTRWQAVQSLGKTGDPAVAEHLASMLKDPDIFVRMATARILGDLGATIGIPALIDALEDPEASVREAAVVSLRSISGRTFRFDPGAKDIERAKRVKAWRDWWKKQGGELVGRT